MGQLDLGQAEFLFHSDALDGVRLNVYRFQGREQISQPFRFVIDLVSDDANLDLESAIGQGARLTLLGRSYDASRYERHVHGVIERFVQTSAGIRHSRYQAVLVPTLRPLHYTRDSRIFQKKSAPDVTLQVLKDGGVPADWVQTLLHSKYGPRDYCVQYQESDLDFVQRLWEEEGIFYFFNHQSDKDVLMLGDGTHAADTLSHYGEVLYRDQPHVYEEGFSRFHAESALHPGAAVLRDFKFKQPSLEMEASAKSDRFSQYKMYYFPGDYVDPGLGQRLAKLRLEEQQCLKSRYVGEGNVRAMVPGFRFTLRGHRRRDCNQEYLSVSVQHEGVQPQALGEEASGVEKASYSNRIESIPVKIPYRPQRTTPRPSIPGVQTAVVVGPSGEEIHCDKHGRVKVKFHWDRAEKKDDSSSCWIRVSQPWGGAGQGGMFIPRVGQEVVVQFLEGDPDRPIILGRVYNGENPVPHGLPAAKNISTIRSASTPGGSGFNEIKFDDTAGSEQMFYHAQRDQHEIVGHDHKIEVKNDQTHTVSGTQNVCVEGKGGAQMTVNHDYKIEGKDSITLICGASSIAMTPKRIEIRSGGGTWIALDKESDGVIIFGAKFVDVHSDAEVDIKGPNKVKINCK